jgi:hypothetical protein
MGLNLFLSVMLYTRITCMHNDRSTIVDIFMFDTSSKCMMSRRGIQFSELAPSRVINQWHRS